MAGALGDPRYDPHGAPIPTAAGEIEETELVTLADAAVGATLLLRQVGGGDENPARLHYLAEQGLTPGTRLTVVERQPFNGPVTVRIGSETRVVGQELALLLLCAEAAR
jgi:DtxR family Mn-dependent transcriptional regulator